MRLIQNSITKRLFLTFSFLILNILLITSLAIAFLWKAMTLDEIAATADDQRLILMTMIKNDADFTRFEPVNGDYFISRKSDFLASHDSLIRVFNQSRITLRRNMQKFDFNIDSQHKHIDTLFYFYNRNFYQLVTKINDRGFKDFGLEGQMRSFAHQLENSRHLPLASLLTLRRHEKDFLLRKESQYIDKFNERSAELLKQLKNKGAAKDAQIIENYARTFNQLTVLNDAIGLNPHGGLQGELHRSAESILEALSQTSTLVTDRKREIIVNSAITFVTISVVAILASIFLTYYTSVRLARPLTKLSGTMSKFMVYEGLNEADVEENETDEISALSQSFIKLSRQVKKQFGEIMYQNKELKKLNEELDRFIYSSAHDLKSPLASLEGLIHLAKSEIADEKQLQYYRMMANAVNKLQGFIRDITDYAKNKRQHLKIEKLDVEEMVNEIVQTVRFLPGTEKLRVIVNIGGDLLYTDRTRLEIVLKNLITNSFRYMDHQKENPLLRIEGIIDREVMKLTIRDNGIGIGKEHIGKIFDMFYRATETSKGTGIGLFLVKESIKMMHGKISVKSVLGDWTSFYLTIPNQRDREINTPETEEVVVEEVS